MNVTPCNVDWFIYYYVLVAAEISHKGIIYWFLVFQVIYQKSVIFPFYIEWRTCNRIIWIFHQKGNISFLLSLFPHEEMQDSKFLHSRQIVWIFYKKTFYVFDRILFFSKFLGGYIWFFHSWKTFNCFLYATDYNHVTKIKMFHTLSFTHSIILTYSESDCVMFLRKSEISPSTSESEDSDPDWGSLANRSFKQLGRSLWFDTHLPQSLQSLDTGGQFRGIYIYTLTYRHLDPLES